MTLLNAACYVSAIAGYNNDEQMTQVSVANEAASTKHDSPE
jgi:hypothetical protein